MKTTEARIKTARIMIVDDEAPNVMLLEHILEHEGFTNIESFSDPRQVLPRFLVQTPDLILLDLRMPYLTGFDVMAQLQPHNCNRTSPTPNFCPS